MNNRLVDIPCLQETCYDADSPRFLDDNSAAASKSWMSRDRGYSLPLLLLHLFDCCWPHAFLSLYLRARRRLGVDQRPISSSDCRLSAGFGASIYTTFVYELSSLLECLAVVGEIVFLIGNLNSKYTFRPL
jgi:hypothetical protein